MSTGESRRKRGAPARPGKRITRRALLVGGVAAAGATALGVLLWSRGAGSVSSAYALAPESALPPDVRRAPADVREAYRFAVANRETLRYIPCFCGCGAEGHTSNASCYLKDSSTPNNPVFDRMSLG